MTYQKTLFRDLFVPPGRTPRIRFCIGLAIIVMSVLLQNIVVKAAGQSMVGFYLGMFWLCLNLYLIYTVFARRLHDLSLSVGPLFAALFLTILIVGFTYWGGGGGDYLETIMANPDIVEDEAQFKALTQNYQKALSDNIGWARWVNLMPLVLLSLFCAIKPSKAVDNKYGPHAPTQT